MLDRTADIEVLSVRTETGPGGREDVVLLTSRGEVECRHYPGRDRRGVAMVGGVGGGFDSPARDLYDRLSAELSREGIAALRVRFRDPTDLEEASLDLLAGLSFLRSKGVDRMGVVGHSFGGAVAVQAAHNEPLVRAVVMLATQSYGTEPLGQLGEGVAVLLIHGREDEVLPYQSSVQAHVLAREPKELVLLDGAGHVLDEAAETVHDEVYTWLRGNL